MLRDGVVRGHGPAGETWLDSKDGQVARRATRDAGKVSPMAVAPDRLREITDALIASIDEGLDGAQVAQRAYLSRFHFDRLARAGLGESPAGFRRRLALERAAWQLRRGASTVLEAGMEAGYASGEAFARAFRRAYGVPPSAFAGAGIGFRLEAPNGIHFHPPAGLLFAGPIDRSTQMDLTDRLLEYDHDDTARLIELAAGLDDAALDERRRPGNVVLDFDGPEETARQIMEKLVFSKEVWVAAMDGGPMPTGGPNDVAALRARHETAGRAFLAIAKRIRDERTWDHVFVDALCEPPQSFSFGSVIVHVTTYAAHRRLVLASVLRELGVSDAKAADPIDWEHAR